MNNIEELIRQTLMLSADTQINDQTTPQDIPAWDSLGHINIITAIEDEYDIEITPEHIAKLESVAHFKELIEELS
jgi:acyl carrier protein